MFVIAKIRIVKTKMQKFSVNNHFDDTNELCPENKCALLQRKLSNELNLVNLLNNMI